MFGVSGTLRRRIYHKIPYPIRKHSFKILVILLCVTAGIPLAFGQISPTSLEATLPKPAVTVWAWVLIWGGASVGVGLTRSYRKFILLSSKIYWMRVQAFGLSLFGWASFLYGACIVSVSFTRGVLASLYIFFFMFCCFIEEMGVQEDIEDLKREAGADVPPR